MPERARALKPKPVSWPRALAAGPGLGHALGRPLHFQDVGVGREAAGGLGQVAELLTFSGGRAHGSGPWCVRIVMKFRLARVGRVDAADDDAPQAWAEFKAFLVVEIKARFPGVHAQPFDQGLLPVIAPLLQFWWRPFLSAAALFPFFEVVDRKSTRLNSSHI